MNSVEHIASRLRPVVANVAFLHGLDFPEVALDRALDEESRKILSGAPSFPPMSQQHLDVALRGMAYRQRAFNPGMNGWFKKLTGISTPKVIKKVEDKAKSVAKKFDDKILRPYVKGATNVFSLGISGRFEKAKDYKEKAQVLEQKYNAVKDVPGQEQEAERLYLAWQGALSLYKKNSKGAKANVLRTGGIAAAVFTLGGTLATQGIAATVKTAATQKLTDVAIEKGVEAALKGDIKDMKNAQAQAAQAAQTAQVAQQNAAPVASSAPRPQSASASMPLIPIGIALALFL